MKKNFIHLLVVTLLMGIFAACSQEETSELKSGKSQLVSVSAELPTELVNARALPTTNDHQLRCILEVWSKDNTPELIYRNEKLGSDATGSKLSFEFRLEAGTYDCLMWADFIDAQATQTAGHYADKYYNTADLKKVTIKDASLLYNSDACDAFFASQELVKNDQQDTQSFDATLARPFAKLIVSEKNKVNFGLCKKVSVSHNVPANFNVAAGIASIETVEAVLADAAPIGAGNTDLRLFSCYAFADADGALKEIALTFKNGEGAELRKTAIPAGVAFQRNHCTKAKGHLIAEASNNTQVEVGVDDDWEADIEDEADATDPTPEVEDPKVGSFYYEDGTWSAALDENKECVGVIFAVGAGKGDVAANYGSKLSQIKGYVMALKSTAKQGLYSAATLPDYVGLSVAIDDYAGYSNTSNFEARNDYSADDNFKVLKSLNQNFKDLAQTSGWYIPSAAQMSDILMPFHSETDNNFKAAVALLIAKEVATSFEAVGYSSTGYITSTISDASDSKIAAGSVYRYMLVHESHAISYKFGKATDTSLVRPIFTF